MILLGEKLIFEVSLFDINIVSTDKCKLSNTFFLKINLSRLLHRLVLIFYTYILYKFKEIQ